MGSAKYWKTRGRLGGCIRAAPLPHLVPPEFGLNSLRRLQWRGGGPTGGWQLTAWQPAAGGGAIYFTQKRMEPSEVSEPVQFSRQSLHPSCSFYLLAGQLCQTRPARALNDEPGRRPAGQPASNTGPPSRTLIAPSKHWPPRVGLLVGTLFAVYLGF